jgi:predicted metal-binding membrane protein
LKSENPTETAVPPPAAALSSRDRLLIWSCLAVVIALAWAYLIYLDRRMASEMEHHTMMTAMGMTMEMPAWTAADVLFTFAMWVVMMIGMMVGTAAPVLLLFAGAHAGRGGRRVPWIVLVFGLGYVIVWAGFSAAAALTQWALHSAAMLSPMMAASSSRVGGAILIAAGVYQLTPFKRACLTHCQSPLGFLMTHWRSGTRGALMMGLRHGAYCLGCCWALFAVLAATGMMSLAWMLLLTLVVFAEKALPQGRRTSVVVGGTLIGLGLAVASGAVSMPWAA